MLRLYLVRAQDERSCLGVEAHGADGVRSHGDAARIDILHARLVPHVPYLDALVEVQQKV